MRYLFLASLLILTLIVNAREQYYFSNLSLDNGLSQITVTSIHEDNKGFMWFGTRNGLNKFDGYKFDIFINDPENNLTISDNHILCMTEDNDGYLWIGTNNGLNRLDRQTNKFKRYFFDPQNIGSLSNNAITSIYVDDEDNLWVGTRNGLNLYNRTVDLFTRISMGGLLNNNPVNALVKDGDSLYLGTFSQGLIVYNINNRKYTSYKHDPDNSGSLAHNHIRSILIDKDRTVWVGTHHGGISVLRKGADSFSVYNVKNGLTNNYIRCMVETPKGEILIGTFNGLNLIDPKTGEISQYKTYGAGMGSLSHYSIYSIYFDRAQTLWVGTYAGGIDYYNAYGQKFRFFNPSFEQKTVLGLIGPIIEKDNSLFIATEGGGLLEMDKSDETFKQYKVFDDSEGAYVRNIFKSLYLDGSRILCGTNLGTIYSFDLKTRKFSLLYNLHSEDAIYYISRSMSGDLIIGGVNRIGFTIISKDGQIRNKFPVNGENDFSFSNIRSILEIEKNVFLLGTRSEGLIYYDLNDCKLSEYYNSNDQDLHTVPDNYISNIFKDNSGNIWIGTFGGGLTHFDLKTREFTTYNTKNGLINNNICSIIEDNNRHLWISTISGISDFDMDSRSFYNYTHASGIKVNEFTPHAGLKLSNGDIVFSGNNGFLSFNPRRMSFNPFIPPIVLKDLYINNHRVAPGEDNDILKENIEGQKEIILKYNETNLTIEYSALNFVFSNRNQYAYMLEGFDQSWNEVGNRRMAYYTNIPAGKYKFIVRGSNNDGVWNNQGTSLIITVLPPIWKTWWAYILYFLLFAGILILIFRYFNEKRRLENDIKLKQAEAKVQDEFHEARNKLFTNFSHELRTPLTLILSPLEDIVEKEESITPKIKDRLLLMRNNALRMLRLVNNLMDFQKKESGSMKLKVSQGDFVQFTEEMFTSFKELAGSRNINFTFNHTEKNIDYWFDKGLMEKVYFNFLSNAFKNVPNGGKVEIKLKRETLSGIIKLYPIKSGLFNDDKIQYITLDIKDSGVGISKNELEKIFIPFYQVAQNEHSASGTGLGLTLSKSIIEMHHGIVWAESPDPGGAIFRCILPISKDYFNPDEIVVDFSEENTLPSVSEISTKQDTIEETAELPEKEKDKKKKPHTILVVEDNKDVKNYIISHLSDTYNILEASDGAEAVDKSVYYLPDLIISDLMMPKMDGMEMSAKIKNDIRTSHIPIIMITARAMTSDIKEGYKVGADDYITKPFNSSVLIARVENIIRSREKLKAIYGKKLSLESVGLETTSLDERFMQGLYQIMEKNMSNPSFKLDDFSRDLGLSRASLYRKIKSVTNLSPNEFIRNYRLEMGAKLLREKKLPVSEVYVAVGFNSIAYFSSSFKIYFGVTPTDYVSQSSGK